MDNTGLFNTKASLTVTPQDIVQLGEDVVYHEEGYGYYIKTPRALPDYRMKIAEADIAEQLAENKQVVRLPMRFSELVEKAPLYETAELLETKKLNRYAQAATRDVLTQDKEDRLSRTFGETSKPGVKAPAPSSAPDNTHEPG